MRAEALLEEVQYLTGQICRMSEAQEMAGIVKASMLPDLNRIQDALIAELWKLLRKVFGKRAFLGAATVPPKYPLELLERLFASIRDVAETMQARATKTTGAQRKKMAAQALELADQARIAAAALRSAAEARGVLSDAYTEEHGLGPWI